MAFINRRVFTTPYTQHPTPQVIPFHFNVDTFGQAGDAGDAGEVKCIRIFVKWYNTNKLQ
jgi:hypothetical protein